MKKMMLLVAFLFCSLLFISAANTYAHDGSWTTSISGWEGTLLGHNDLDPFKGWATLTVTNTMSQSWGDFHFEIYEFMTHNVIFPASATEYMFDNSMNPYAGYSYALDGTQKLNFYFYGNPVLPGQTVTFKVYTDNTANQLAWFGLTVYPTPVPEPMTLTLLSLGVAALIRKQGR